MELRLLRLPLVRFFETSFGRVHDRFFVLVTVEGDGATGVGECVADSDPFYSQETTRTAWHIISEFIAPIVLGRDFSHPRDLYPALGIIRGHNMAKAAVEMAFWDMFARSESQPLCRVLGGSDALIRTGIASGVKNSGGILDHQVRDLHVECLPGQIPDAFELDVTLLEIHDSLRISDLTIPEGVKLLDDLDRVVVSVAVPRAEVVAEPTAEVVAAAEPEIIKKGKTDAEEAEPPAKK